MNKQLPPQVMGAPATLSEMIQNAVDVDHRALRQEFASTGRIVTNVNKRGQFAALVTPLCRAFLRLAEEVEANLQQEETVLFPALIAAEQALRAGRPLPVNAFGSVRNPISMMEQSHTRIRAILDEIRNLSGGFTLREPSCEMIGLFNQALQLLDGNLREHLDHEDREIFPRAKRLDREDLASGIQRTSNDPRRSN